MNIFKIVSVSVWLVGALHTSGVYAVTSSGALPEWVTDQTGNQQCAVGVADKNAVAASEEAMHAALLELGMMQAVKVDSLDKMFSEKTVIKHEELNSQVVRLLAETSAKKVLETKNWREKSGDYFAQVCVDDKGSNLKPVVGVLKSFIEENKINSSAAVKRSLDLSIGNMTRVKGSVQFNYVGSKSRLLDQIHNESLQLETLHDNEEDGYSNVAVAQISVRDANFAQAYLQAMASARSKLANMFSKKIYKDSKSNAEELSAANAGKTVTSEVLKNTMVEKVYFDKIDGSLYMTMTHEFSDQDIKKVLSLNTKK